MVNDILVYLNYPTPIQAKPSRCLSLQKINYLPVMHTVDVDFFSFFFPFWNLINIYFFIQDLAKELLELFTARKMAKAFFVNSGSEANDTQVCLINYPLICYCLIVSPIHFRSTVG